MMNHMKADFGHLAFPDLADFRTSAIAPLSLGG